MGNRAQWKNQFHLYESASLFHNKVREIFITDQYWKQLHCFQEVSVKDLVESYPNRYDAIDWFVDELNTVLELHGIQHYKMQSFGSQDSFFNQKKAFNNIKYRDNRKKTFLSEAGYNYIALSYKDVSKLSSEYLKSIILN